MSKAVFGIVLAVAAIAVPFIAPILLPASIGVFASAAIVAGLEVGIALTSSLLLGPSKPKLPGSLADGGRDRLTVSLDPTTPRKIVFGNTAMATDLRYQTFTGADQEYYHQIICCASHEVQSIDEIWLDNEKAWTSAGGVQGRYIGYLTVTARTLGTSSNGIAIDGVWTSSCTLTGCAYVYLQYKLTGNSDAENSAFAGGVTQRMTIRGKGAKVYDPRLDSTVAGGSGSQRANNQSTWAWNDNASRNPALQELWYKLGWKINSKLAVGMGMPPARIDLASYIAGANDCDESITLNGGGTEPRYRSDGVLSEGDDRRSVIETLCTTMNASLRDAGGKLALTVFKDDLATPVTPSGRSAFTQADILGDEEWVQTQDLHQFFNIVRGRRIDPSDHALYQPVDFAEVKLTSIDGIDRIDTVDYMLVQSNGQAQRLAKQRLERAQYQGRYSFTGGPEWWQTKIGDVVPLSHAGLGWTAKLFRVASQGISRGGETRMVLVEENSAIYDWDNSEAAAVTPGTPTVYDPNNHPVIVGINERRLHTGNMLTDMQFSRKWTLSAGAARSRADANAGFAQGDERFYLELSPDTSLVRSALSERVRVNPGQKYYFAARAQRGTTLGSGSRLNFGGQWLGADGTTVVGTFVEGTQQTPSSLTAGALPKEVAWSDTAPATAYFVQLKFYTPALASSSGTFRVEKPWVSIVDPGGTPFISVPIAAFFVNYDADGTVVAGELSFDIGASLLLGAVAQGAGVTWTYKVKSGSVNGHAAGTTSYSMSGSGAGTLTVSSVEADNSTVEITASAANGSSAVFPSVSVVKVYAPATPGTPSGSDSPSQTSGFTAFNSGSFAAITNVLTYTHSGTSATVTFNLSCKPVKTGTSPWTVQFKIQRNISGTWTDVGGTMSASSDLNDDSEIVIPVPAVFNSTRSSTGMTAGAQDQWRAVARISAGATGSAGTHNVTGSISVAS